MDTGTGRERFAAGRFLPRVDANRTLAPGTLESGSRPEQVWTRPKTANKVLGIIKLSYEDKSMANLLPLDKALVRPHIEYCVQAWRHYYQKNVDNLEKIQRRAIRMMDDLRGMEYEERLRQTRLVTQEARRTRAKCLK